MEKITDYKIIEKGDPNEMTGAVKAYIEEGWQPLGPPYIVYTPDPYDAWNYSQTIVKYATDPRLTFIEQELAKGLEDIHRAGPTSLRGEVKPPPVDPMIPDGLVETIASFSSKTKRSRR